ncbi:MAG TPA: acyl transferase [Chitinophagales bacterium]|nr:acyl transferase [Chitinophagales bacterium]HNM31122.1 acyl transferase [Chitinophagales bacterium]
MVSKIREKIFSGEKINFEEIALSLFEFQYLNNPIYRQFTDYLNINYKKVQSISQIPFLPIDFFKTHSILTQNAAIEKIFESSGTTGQITSKHFVADLSLYEQSFINGFELFYGAAADWIILALLPSYLERNTSSLVYMVDDLIKKTNNEHSGFYLNNLQELAQKITYLKEIKNNKKILLIGVTFALLDFAEQFPMDLTEVVIMETGGMKGRRKEMMREEVHAILKQNFNVPQIHSEYGMTELLSQGYSAGEGIFKTPPWLKILKRDLYNPLQVSANSGRGALNIIDMANIYSCAFIATQDLVNIISDSTFEIIGRTDNSDIRGCNLMVAL